MLKNSKWVFFLLSLLLLANLPISFAEEGTTSEALTDDEMATYKLYHYQEKIHPKHEKFDFTISYHWEENKGFQGGNPASIQVAGTGGHLLQTIDLNWVSVLEPKCYITDINFDGYKDILLLVANTSPRGSSAYRGWLWNNRKKEFEEFEGDLPINLVIDRERKKILSTEVWMKGRNYRIFEFRGKELVKIGELDIDYLEVGDEAQTNEIQLGLYTESRFKKGKQILDFQFNLNSVEDGNDEIILKRYYSPKSFWRLNDFRWYKSDDGDGLESKRNSEKIDIEK